MNDINDKSNLLKAIIDYIQLWYEAYIKTIKFLGAISAGILIFTTTFLVRDLRNLNSIDSSIIGAQDFFSLKISFVLFSICLIFVLINLLVTYSWFVSALDRGLQELNVDLHEILGDPFTYRRNLPSMKIWGLISLWSGIVAGVSFCIGIIFYGLFSWSIINIIITKQ